MITMLISAVLFGVMSFLVKILSAEMSAGSIVFGRFIFGFLGILILAIFKVVDLTFNNKFLLLLRGVIGATAIVFFFNAISLIPVSDAVVLQFTYPVFAIIFASFFLEEKIKFSTIVAMITAFIGIFLISSPIFKEINMGYFYGMLAAVFAGAAIALTRFLRRTDNTWSITLSLMLAGSIIGALLSVNNPAVPEAGVLSTLLLMSAVATTGQLLLNYSYGFINVAVGGTISMFTVPTTILLALFFLGETLTVPFLIGTFLVLASVVYLFQAHS